MGDIFQAHQMKKGLHPPISLDQKFGINSALTTSYLPVSFGGIYRTPQVSGALPLRIKAGNANDDVAGSGAQEVTLVGLDTDGNEQVVPLATAGTSASAASANSFLRFYRAFVSKSGTYSNLATLSHAAAIVIEDTGGTVWGTIDATTIARGQTQIGCFTVPLGYVATVDDGVITPDTNGAVDLVFFKRESILDAAAPYQAVRFVEDWVGVDSPVPLDSGIDGLFPELTDIGFLAKRSSPASVSVTFSIAKSKK